MAKFISRDKLGKKARRALDAQGRTLWTLSPVSRKTESKKRYNRKKDAHAWKDLLDCTKASGHKKQTLA